MTMTPQKYPRVLILSNYEPHASLSNTNYLQEGVNVRAFFVEKFFG